LGGGGGRDIFLFLKDNSMSLPKVSADTIHSTLRSLEEVYEDHDGDTNAIMKKWLTRAKKYNPHIIDVLTQYGSELYHEKGCDQAFIFLQGAAFVYNMLDRQDQSDNL
jgi:hypothetical protein